MTDHMSKTQQEAFDQRNVLLNIREAMTLIEFLAVASKPGSESRVINTLPST